MKTPLTLTKPVQFYFILFLGLGAVFISALLWSFYSEGLGLQKAAQNESLKDAHTELKEALEVTLDSVQKELQTLADWDEVHQQYQDSSYYFFWQEKRLHESEFYRTYYDQFELYNRDGKRLIPGSPNFETTGHYTLPAEVQSPEPTLVLIPGVEAHLNLFTPVYDRQTHQVIGHIGLSIDLKRALYFYNQFHLIDKSSLHFAGNGHFSINRIQEFAEFEVNTDPTNAHLWELIPSFIFQLSLMLLIFAALVILLFHKMIRRPLVVLSSYLQKLKASPGHPVAPPAQHFWIEEFDAFRKAIYQYHNDLQQAQNDLDRQNLIVWEQARRDALTNVYNRRAFDETWSETLLHYRSQPIPTTFMLFDCDFFKALNDTYGHEVGDEVIRISAKTIQQTLPLECPAYRIGGDEFAVIVQGHTEEEVVQIAEKCLRALNAYPYQSIGIKEKLSFSVGISDTVSRPKDDLTSLPRQADIAMYKAKQQSTQTKVQVYHPALEDESRALVSSEAVNTIVDAVHTGSNLVMHFQPIISVDGKLSYYEALVRIQRNKKLISPRDIFSVVERRRLEVELDRQVIRQTFKLLQEGHIPPGHGLSINISGKTLLQLDLVSLFEPFEPLLESHPIQIEITENTLIDHMEYAQEVLNRLRSKGFLIALDDFGSGYSSIRYLAHMPVDVIKFDLSMTHTLIGDEKSRQIILSTADMIRQSGYKLVMEGIENDVLLEQAKQAGATHLQGFLIGKPSQEILPPFANGTAS